MTNFQIDPILERDSVIITNLKLCQIRLINNSDFPWLILIPMKNNITEIMDLSHDEYNQMNIEIKFVATKFKQITEADKLNIATIGNVVSQLHIHIIARMKNDKLFPKPVWGHTFTPYTKENIGEIIQHYQKNLTN